MQRIEVQNREQGDRNIIISRHAAILNELRSDVIEKAEKYC